MIKFIVGFVAGFVSGFVFLVWASMDIDPIELEEMEDLDDVRYH